jgi:hypothetical protein
MGPPIGLRTRLWLGGLAAGGVALAHLVAFLIAAPYPVRREELLEATGHGAWPVLVTIAMGGLVAALAGFAAGRLREARPASPAVLFRATIGRLVILQVAAFILLEGLERLASGHDLAELWSEPVLGIGLVAQVFVALAGAVLLALFARLVDRLVLLFRGIPRAPRLQVPRQPLDLMFSTRIATDPANPRGPPRRI